MEHLVYPGLPLALGLPNSIIAADIRFTLGVPFCLAFGVMASMGWHTATTPNAKQNGTLALNPIPD
jgi:hypothetical protein